MMLAELVSQNIESVAELDGEADLGRCLAAANRVVWPAVQTGSLRGAGATVAAMTRLGSNMAVAWVGDVRVYRLHDDRLQLLTRDHSLRNDHIDQGLLRPDDPRLKRLPENVIVRALGMAAEVEPGVALAPCAPGDVFVLASDAAYRSLGEPTLASMLREAPADPRLCVLRISEAAKQRGANGQITVVIVCVPGGTAGPQAAVLSAASGDRSW